MSLALAAIACAASIAEVPEVDSASGRVRGIALPSSPVGAAIEKVPFLAIASVAGTDVESDDLSGIADRLEDRIAKTEAFRVLPREDFDRVLRRKGLRSSGACEDARCLTEFGKLLGIDAILSAELVHEGDDLWVLSVRQVDVAAGSIVFKHDLEVRGSLRDVRGIGCSRMAEMLAGRRNPGSNRSIVAGKGFLDWPWIAGGVVVAGGMVAAAVLLFRDDPEEPERKTVATEQTVVRW